MSTYITRIIEVKLPDIDGEVYKEEKLNEDKYKIKDKAIYKIGTDCTYRVYDKETDTWSKQDQCTWSWHMVKYYGEHNKSYYHIDSKPDGSINGFDVSEINNFYDNGGSIRDIYLSTWNNEYNYTNRGLPDDISKEAKEHMHMDENYTWGHTYVTLNEWNSVYTNELKKFKEKIKENIINNKIEKLNEKIDKIYNKLFDIKTKKRKKEVEDEIDYEDTYEYLWKEDFIDLDILGNEITKVSFIVDQIYGYIPYDRIRINYYFS